MTDRNLLDREPLGYRTRASVEPAPRVRFWAQVAIGFGATVLAFGLGAGIAGATKVYRWSQEFWLGTAISVPLLALVAAVLYFRLKWRWRGFLLGVLLALGLAGLLIGGCFMLLILTFTLD